MQAAVTSSSRRSSRIMQAEVDRAMQAAADLVEAWTRDSVSDPELVDHWFSAREHNFMGYWCPGCDRGVNWDTFEAALDRYPVLSELVEYDSAQTIPILHHCLYSLRLRSQCAPPNHRQAHYVQFQSVARRFSVWRREP
jgi:hypothetical protein